MPSEKKKDYCELKSTSFDTFKLIKIKIDRTNDII